jgi:hypothetical protein
MKVLCPVIATLIFFLWSTNSVLAQEKDMASELNCEGPQFSAAQLAAIIKRERSVRSDLPAEPTAYTTSIRRQRCHYIYMETPDGGGAHDETTFVLDQFGVIVDAVVGRGNPSALVDCPKRRLTDEEVQQAVNLERKRFGDLPPAPANYSVSVTPKRCMYFYVEKGAPNAANESQSLSFTVDQYGAVYSVYRN